MGGALPGGPYVHRCLFAVVLFPQRMRAPPLALTTAMTPPASRLSCRLLGRIFLPQFVRPHDGALPRKSWPAAPGRPRLAGRRSTAAPAGAPPHQVLVSHPTCFVRFPFDGYTMTELFGKLIIVGEWGARA